MRKGQDERLELLSRWNDYLTIGVGFLSLVLGPVILARAIWERAQPLYYLVGILFTALGIYRLRQYLQYRRRR